MMALYLVGIGVALVIIGGIVHAAFTEVCLCGKRGFHLGGGECGP